MKNWVPPSLKLECSDGVWRPPGGPTPISYPEEGNDFFSAVETTSFWFHHRNHCILRMVQAFSPNDLFYDIGGGNGWVAVALEREGISTVLVEPGRGVQNARRRGLTRIVQSPLKDAGFSEGSLPAAGCFDVLEHIPRDAEFCQLVYGLLKPGGFFFCTVPAGPWLWSQEDESAGHCRRYTASQLYRLLQQAGFAVDFLTHIFSWMSFPLFFGRTLPAWFCGKRTKVLGLNRKSAEDHSLPGWLQPVISPIHAWELQRLQAGRAVPWGTSILAVARKNGGAHFGRAASTAGQTKYRWEI